MPLNVMAPAADNPIIRKCNCVQLMLPTSSKQQVVQDGAKWGVQLSGRGRLGPAACVKGSAVVKVAAVDLHRMWCALLLEDGVMVPTTRRDHTPKPTTPKPTTPKLMRSPSELLKPSTPDTPLAFSSPSKASTPSVSNQPSTSDAPSSSSGPS